MKTTKYFALVLLTGIVFCAGAFMYGVDNLYAEGRIISITNIKEWQKQHPDVDINKLQKKDGQTGVVQVTTVKEWLKAHPNVDPKNIKKFDPPVNPAGIVPLTPTLAWKNPQDTVKSSILIVKKDNTGETVLEANDIQGESFTIPKDKLTYSTDYVWQIAHIKKSSEIVDGGTFKFTTNKAPAPKLKK